MKKHAWRAEIILLSAAGVGTNEIMRRTGKSKTCVWRWQARFMEEGVEGLLRDKTRPARIAALAPHVTQRVVALTRKEPPAGATHWTGAMMARVLGVSVSSVRRIWQAYGLQPHRLRVFRRSTDPGFAASLSDVVGLYVDYPAHAIVLSVDGGRPPDRALPTPPSAKVAGAAVNGDRRRSLTNLFATLGALDAVAGRERRRRRVQEFFGFLDAIEAKMPSGKSAHVILDKDAARRYPDVGLWLVRHERFTFHFITASRPWREAVEDLLVNLLDRRLKRGVLRSVAELETVLAHFVDDSKGKRKPFIWTGGRETGVGLRRARRASGRRLQKRASCNR